MAEIITIAGDMRVWGDRNRVHKMGWLRPHDEIKVLSEYGNWVRFEPYTTCPGLLKLTAQYPNYFLNRLDQPAPGPSSPPAPEEISDAELGAAVRIIFRAFRS